MTKILTRATPALAAALLLLAGGAAVGCRRGGDAATKAQATKPQYHCPMHPTYVSDRPGQCPICRMDLVPIQTAATAHAERKVLFYRSPMDPSIRSNVPRKDDMGMDSLAGAFGGAGGMAGGASGPAPGPVAATSGSMGN